MPDSLDVKMVLVLVTNLVGFASLFATARANLLNVIQRVDRVEKKLENGLMSKTARIEERVMELHRDVDAMKKLTDRVTRVEAHNEAQHGTDKRRN